MSYTLEQIAKALVDAREIIHLDEIDLFSKHRNIGHVQRKMNRRVLVAIIEEQRAHINLIVQTNEDCLAKIKGLIIEKRDLANEIQRLRSENTSLTHGQFLIAEIQRISAEECQKLQAENAILKERLSKPLDPILCLDCEQGNCRNGQCTKIVSIGCECPECQEPA